MSFDSEKDLEGHRILNGVDLLDKALEYRTLLGCTKTELSELYAFVSYAVSFPQRFIALVDSYSTLGSGVYNFLCVALALNDLGYKSGAGVRLDSGDLAHLSKEAKRIFRETGEKL